MVLKLTKVLKLVFCLLAFVPFFSHALEFTLPKDVTEEELTNASEEKAEYGDSKQQRELEKAVPAEKSKETQKVAESGPEKAAEPLEVDEPEDPEEFAEVDNDEEPDEIENAETAEADDDDPGFMEFTLEEPEAQSEADLAEAEVQEATAEGQGQITGQVFDKETGTPVRGVAIAVEGTDFGTITDDKGNFKLTKVPEGNYTLAYFKIGYLAANVTDVAVASGKTKKVDFALPPRPAEMSDDVYDLGTIAVTAEQANDMMMKLELRMDSDKIVDFFSAEDFSKFAASDVAEALTRVSGVSVVEGQFAVIRGLSDRYNSTTLNGATVPSPDPVRQSVQLDLFPSEVVSNLEISKSFSPGLPGNSAGGSIDIQTYNYPDELTITVNAGSGFNDNAMNTFFEARNGSAVPVGENDSPYEYDYGFNIGGKFERFEREFRYNLSANQSKNFSTREGIQETRRPQPGSGFEFVGSSVSLNPSSLGYGLLPSSDGFYDYTRSIESSDESLFLSAGFDLDTEGNHRLDGLFFYTEVEEEYVELSTNGFIPGIDTSSLSSVRSSIDTYRVSSDFLSGIRGPAIGSFISQAYADIGSNQLFDGAFTSANFQQSESVFRDRDLEIYQLNGDHIVNNILKRSVNITWAANYAETSQTEESLRFSYWFQPDDPELSEDANVFVTRIGNDAADDVFFSNSNIVEETQGFFRADIDYKIIETNNFDTTLFGGIHYENAERDAESLSQVGAIIGSNAFFADTPEQLWAAFRGTLDFNNDGNFDELDGLRLNFNKSERDINSAYFNVKFQVLEVFDIFAGFRNEQIRITSNNRTLNPPPGVFSGGIFPTRYLLFDTFDGSPLSDGTFEDVLELPSNSEILGIDVPRSNSGTIDLGNDEDVAALINSEIDEHFILPAFGFTHRIIEGLNLRANYSETVSRPSFREISYYVSTDPFTGDLTIGNPQLGLSEAKNYDLRVEYFYGDKGDLIALSVFRKEIESPIEQIIVADLITGQNFRTYFNNPNTADLEGLELEFSQNLGFIAESSFLQYFTIGGNATWIDAAVNRPEALVERYSAYYEPFDPFGGALPVVDNGATFKEYPKERRLYDQPEFIYNLNFSFYQQDWGTKLTLAYFQISDVLFATGSTEINRNNGQTENATLDEYIGEFYQLDLILRQEWKNWIFSFSIKNVTDSRRTIFYDSAITSEEILKEDFHIGRDYSISASYTF